MPLWARFYELGTNRPIFLGRDSVVRYAFAEIELERRIGYSYYGTWPATLLSRDYPDWRRKHHLRDSRRPSLVDRRPRPAAEGIHRGARTMNQWRVAFLRDLAGRLRRTTPLAEVANQP